MELVKEFKKYDGKLNYHPHKYPIELNSDGKWVFKMISGESGELYVLVYTLFDDKKYTRWIDFLIDFHFPTDCEIENMNKIYGEYLDRDMKNLKLVTSVLRLNKHSFFFIEGVDYNKFKKIQKEQSITKIKIIKHYLKKMVREQLFPNI